MKAPACFPEYKFDCIHREITDTGTAFTEVKTVRKYRRRASDGRMGRAKSSNKRCHVDAPWRRCAQPRGERQPGIRLAQAFLEGLRGSATRECALLPVTVDEVNVSCVKGAASSSPAASAHGAVRIQLPQGAYSVKGAPIPTRCAS